MDEPTAGPPHDPGRSDEDHPTGGAEQPPGETSELPGPVAPHPGSSPVPDPSWWTDHDLPGSAGTQPPRPLPPPWGGSSGEPPETDPFDPDPFLDPYPLHTEAPVHPDRPGPSWLGTLIAAVLGSVITVATLWWMGALGEDTPEATPPAAQIREVREIVTDTEGGATVAAVGRKVTPSIVTIQIGTSAPQGFRRHGVGSGVVLSTDGLIVTNAHVVEGAAAVRVVLHDGSYYDAETVGADAPTDLAVLSIGASGLVPIEAGGSEGLAIGEEAIAVGNPLGLRGGASLTAGVVSALDRQVTAAGADPLYGMLQTDAPITQGSSGGALVDERGRLIGITTAIGVSTAGAEGVGFAIPVELMERITDELIAEGEVRHAFLGVELQNHFDERDDGATVPAGALIAGLTEDHGSAAAEAGMSTGDIIVGLDGDPIATREELIGALKHHRVGDRVNLRVRRDDRHLGLDVVLGENRMDR